MVLQAQLLHIPIGNERLATRRSPFRSARIRCCPHGPSRCPRYTGLKVVVVRNVAKVIDSQGRRALVLVASSAAVRLRCLLDTRLGHSARR
jgi:hypothetical protein